MEQSIKKQITATVVSKDHLSAIRKELPADTYLAWASVEKPDASNDVMRIDGMDWSDYHNPTVGKHMSMLAGHAISLANGEPPITGRVEQFYKAEYPNGDSTVPALAFAFTFSPNDLGQKYKQLYDAGYMNSFSIGAMYNYKDVTKAASGGMDIAKCKLYEISPVTVPANSDATAIRAIKGILGDDLFNSIKGVDNADLLNSLKTLSAEVDSLKKVVEQILSFDQNNKKVLSDILSISKEASERYDMLESLLIVDSANAKSSTKAQKPDQKVGLSDDTVAIAKKLDELIKIHSK